MIQSEFSSALKQIAVERGIPPEAIIESIKAAMVSAYHKEYEESIPIDEEINIDVKIDPESGEVALFRDNKDITPSGFGRIAAQTAKQVIIQKINEAERSAVIEEYQHKIGMIVSGSVFRVEKGNVIVELGKAQAVMPLQEQIPGEYYHQGRRVRALLLNIREGDRGPEILLSRSHPDFVKGLFALEVPEINLGTVLVDNIAREAGLRSKVAVHATQDKIDPVGSCVGQKGVRVQAIMEELGEERVDIIPFDNNPATYIGNSLSPAKVTEIEINEAEHSAIVEVGEDQLSLAIGKGGQNVRLAAKLTGWKIDIKGADSLETPDQTPAEETAVVEEVLTDEKLPTEKLPAEKKVTKKKSKAVKKATKKLPVEETQVDSEVTETPTSGEEALETAETAEAVPEQEEALEIAEIAEVTPDKDDGIEEKVNDTDEDKVDTDQENG